MRNATCLTCSKMVQPGFTESSTTSFDSHLHAITSIDDTYHVFGCPSKSCSCSCHENISTMVWIPGKSRQCHKRPRLLRRSTALYRLSSLGCLLLKPGCCQNKAETRWYWFSVIVVTLTEKTQSSDDEGQRSEGASRAAFEARDGLRCGRDLE